jgi:hypothetical protein
VVLICSAVANGTNDSSRVAKIALFLGLFSTFLGIASTVFTFYRTSPAGEVKVVEPLSGYAIVRGIDPTYPNEPDPKKGLGVGPFPSDHIVLPLEWSNGTGSPVLIKNPKLVLRELKENGNTTERTLEFFLVGEFPEASVTVFNNVNKKPHNFTNSVIVEPHSVKQTVSVYRVSDWVGENACLRFHQGQNYQVDLTYDRIPQDPTVRLGWWLGASGGGTITQSLVDDMPILNTANLLSPYGQGGSIGWDYVSLLPGSRASSAKDLPEDATKYYDELEQCS